MYKIIRMRMGIIILGYVLKYKNFYLIGGMFFNFYEVKKIWLLRYGISDYKFYICVK